MASNNDLYGDGQTAQSDPAEGTAADQKEDQGAQTALLPKSLCPGMKVGSTIELKIVGSHDSDYEVEYEPSGKHSDASESEPAGQSDASGAGMYG